MTREAIDVPDRGSVGARASRVVPTPVRAALLALDHGAASVVAIQATGTGLPSGSALSAQAYGLRFRIRPLDGWCRAPASGRR